jgi:hypothetical protein
VGDDDLAQAAGGSLTIHSSHEPPADEDAAPGHEARALSAARASSAPSAESNLHALRVAIAAPDGGRCRRRV